MRENKQNFNRSSGELEQDARIALLQHYSSKSSNEVTNALTIALIFFAFVAALEALTKIPADWAVFIFAIVFIPLAALMVHTVLRLLYWGTLAGHAIGSEFVSGKYQK